MDSFISMTCLCFIIAWNVNEMWKSHWNHEFVRYYNGNAVSRFKLSIQKLSKGASNFQSSSMKYDKNGWMSLTFVETNRFRLLKKPSLCFRNVYYSEGAISPGIRFWFSFFFSCENQHFSNKCNYGYNKTIASIFVRRIRQQQQNIRYRFNFALCALFSIRKSDRQNVVYWDNNKGNCTAISSTNYFT